MKQTESQYFVYNADDPVIVAGLWQTKAQAVPFSLKKKVDGAYLFDKTIYYKNEKVLEIASVLLKGDHNLQDVLGAVAVCKIYGCDTESIRQVLRRFSGVRHRLQFVAEIAGVKYYNNSKATNVIATEMALKAFENPIILIAGGLDRGHDLRPLAQHFNKVKAILAYGETKQRFKQLAKESQILCQVFEDLNETVEAATKIATKGDCVLFSPACASWDQYMNFEKRGDYFIELVESLKQKEEVFI